jgi:hypothetical protein
MNDYRIWFKVNGTREIELPVNPSEVTITYPANPTNYDVEGVGDVIVSRIPKLATVTFESFFPKEKVYISAANNDRWYSPEWYVSFFRNLQKSRKPFELTIVRGSDQVFEDVERTIQSETRFHDTVFAQAVLLDISFTDKGGEPGDVYYNMSISEYRDAAPKTLAELARQTFDEDGNVLEQEMVIVKDRPPQSGVIVPKRTVQINGDVYNNPEEDKKDWKKTRQQANRIDRVVTRVLPPSVSGIIHGVYVDGLGWVDQSICRLGEFKGTATSLERIKTDEYV